uniref:Uncharacterized protein n=1 Tax=Aegilops tauschii TaxID=37682 RepID=M8C9U2_AEGTA
MSRLAALYRLIATDEQLRHMEQEGSTKTAAGDEQDEGLELCIPPVFDRCSKVLDPGEQIAARDLYWEAICSDGKEGVESLGLRLGLEWGSSWDKRMSWEGWVSWGRVMRDKAKEKQWPRSAWGIINLGLVEQINDHN